HILHSDIHLLNLIDELGLSIEWRKIKVGFYYQGRIYPFNGVFDLIKFKPLPFGDRLKLGLLFLSIRNKKNLEDLEKISIQKWIERESGTRIYEKFINPLISAYFGSSSEISAAYLANRWRTESKSIAGLLGYMDISEITTRLEKYILDNGGTISRKSNIQEINKADENFILKTNDKEQRTKYLVSTIPPPILTKIFKTMPLDLKDELSRISYMGCICVSYWMNKKTSEYYWINILDKDYPFVACFEHSNLNPCIRGGLVYAVCYLNESDILWKKSDEEIVNHFAAYLPKI
ncbi:hypothetical protein A3K80_06455, partial [Candidatus Bathyarchaeota archaeon RBG_13_38_9]